MPYFVKVTEKFRRGIKNNSIFKNLIEKIYKLRKKGWFMIKTPDGKVISTNVAVSTITEFGSGMMPYLLWKPYHDFLKVAQKSATQILKSFTYLEEQGNFVKYKPWTWWKYIKRINGDGIANAYKHTNPGAAACAEMIRKAIIAGGKIIPNYAPDFSKPPEQMITETIQVVKLLISVLKSDSFTLELKLYCPNLAQDLEKNVVFSKMLVLEIRKLFPNLFLIIKINYQHPFELSQEMERLGVGAIHAINSINHSLISNGRPNPLGLDDCAISGGPIKSYSLSYNRELRKKINIPILMGGGIMSISDAREFMDIGANTVVICSMVARHTKEAIKLIEIYN